MCMYNAHQTGGLSESLGQRSAVDVESRWSRSYVCNDTDKLLRASCTMLNFVSRIVKRRLNLLRCLKERHSRSLTRLRKVRSCCCAVMTSALNVLSQLEPAHWSSRHLSGCMFPSMPRIKCLYSRCFYQEWKKKSFNQVTQSHLLKYLIIIFL